LMALIVLGAVALISLIYGIVTPSKMRQRAQAARKEAADVPRPAVEPIKVLVAEERYPKRGSYSEWGKSPFVMSHESQDKLTRSALVLGGIAWDAISPKAVINDSIVVVGDEIEGRKVVAIHPGNVILTDGEKEIQLGLEPTENKKKSRDDPSGRHLPAA